MITIMTLVSIQIPNVLVLEKDLARAKNNVVEAIHKDDLTKHMAVTDHVAVQLFTMRPLKNVVPTVELCSGLENVKF